RHELRLTDPAHDFLRNSAQPGQAAASARHAELTTRITVTITTIGDKSGAGSRQPGVDASAFGPIRLLVVRIVHEDIGTIPLDLARAPGISVHAPGCLTGSVLCPGSHQVEVAEWRSDGADGAEVPW